MVGPGAFFLGFRDQALDGLGSMVHIGRMSATEHKTMTTDQIEREIEAIEDRMLARMDARIEKIMERADAMASKILEDAENACDRLRRQFEDELEKLGRR